MDGACESATRCSFEKSDVFLCRPGMSAQEQLKECKSLVHDNCAFPHVDCAVTALLSKSSLSESEKQALYAEFYVKAPDRQLMIELLKLAVKDPALSNQARLLLPGAHVDSWFHLAASLFVQCGVLGRVASPSLWFMVHCVPMLVCVQDLEPPPPLPPPPRPPE